MAFNKEKVMDAARKFVDKGQIDKAVKSAVDGARKVIAGSLYAVIELLVTLFLLFYFLRDRRDIVRRRGRWARVTLDAQGGALTRVKILMYRPAAK